MYLFTRFDSYELRAASFEQKPNLSTHEFNFCALASRTSYRPLVLLATDHRPLATVLGVRNHACCLLVISIAHQSGFAQVLLALLRLRAQDVTQPGLMALDLSRPGLLKALRSAFVCF